MRYLLLTLLVVCASAQEERPSGKPAAVKARDEAAAARPKTMPEIPYVQILYMVDMPGPDLKAGQTETFVGWFDLKTQTLYPNTEGDPSRVLVPLRISQYSIRRPPNDIPDFVRAQLTKPKR